MSGDCIDQHIQNNRPGLLVIDPHCADIFVNLFDFCARRSSCSVVLKLSSQTIYQLPFLTQFRLAKGEMNKILISFINNR